MITIGTKKAKCFSDYLPLGLNKYLDVKYKIEIFL